VISGEGSFWQTVVVPEIDAVGSGITEGTFNILGDPLPHWLIGVTVMVPGPFTVTSILLVVLLPDQPAGRDQM
jgi:hypothetical protein